MKAPDTAAALRAALLDRAETAMAVTDTERELDELRARLLPAVRTRRLRMLAAAAAVAVTGAGIGVGLAASSGTSGPAPAPGTRPPQTPGPHWRPPGSVPAGFPSGSYQHPGTYGLTKLTLRRNGTAALQDPRDEIPTQMRMTFATPNFVRFTDTEPSGPTVTTSCTDHDGVYRWTVARGDLTLTVVSDPCGARQIPLSEIPWGPIVRR